MGSSLYAMDCIRSYLTQHTIPRSPSVRVELSRYQFKQITPKTLIVAISQSGNSAEVVELVEKAKAVAPVVAFTITKLQAGSHGRLPAAYPCGKEVSITSKTYEITMLILNILARKLTANSTAISGRRRKRRRTGAATGSPTGRNRPRPCMNSHRGPSCLTCWPTILRWQRQESFRWLTGRACITCTAVWECADYAHGQYHKRQDGGALSCANVLSGLCRRH